MRGGGRGAPRGRGNGRGGFGQRHFQWRRNGVPAGPDRPANPGPSRPANPGPNNPNYNLNHAPWQNEQQNEAWPRSPPSPGHHFDNQYGFDNRRGNIDDHREFHPPRDQHFDTHDESHFDRGDNQQHFDHPPRYDHHTMIETEKRHQSLLQSSPHHMDNRRPPSPRVFYSASPSKTNNIIDLSDSPSFINERSPRYENANSNERWPHDQNQFEPNPADPIQFQVRDSGKKFIDYSLRVNPLDRTGSPDPDQRRGDRPYKRETRNSRETKDSDTRTRITDSRHRSKSPRRKKKSSKDRHRDSSSSRHKTSSRSARVSKDTSRKRKRVTPEREITLDEPVLPEVSQEAYNPDNVADNSQELYEPDSGNEETSYIPAPTDVAILKTDESVDVPKEYKDVSVYMTQVLETMIERQRLEMHQKLNEMFKTYFDAKELELSQPDGSDIKRDDEDDELDKLRQAAIRSSETKRTFENSELSNETEELAGTDSVPPEGQQQKFENFDQYKKYKQKMREQGRTDQSLIVSIPNITAEGVDIDAELNLPTPETTERADSKEPVTDVTLQVQIENNSDSSTSRKISTEAIPTGTDIPEENGKEAETSESQLPKPSPEPVVPKPVIAVKPATIKTSDLTHRDPGKHWCGVTSKWLNSIHDLLKHLHSDEYQAKLPNKDKPWKRRLDMFQTKLKERDEMNEVIKRTCEMGKGSEFFVPIQAFKCRLCEKIFRTEADMMCHFLGPAHNKKYDEMNFNNSNYEYQRLQRIQVAVKEQQKALEHQKNAYREKLEQKRRLAERKAVSKISPKSGKTAPPPLASFPTDEVLKNVSRKLEEEKKTETRESSVLSDEKNDKKLETKPDRKRKPRSAAIERILAMTKRKRISKKAENGDTPQEVTPVGSPAGRVSTPEVTEKEPEVPDKVTEETTGQMETDVRSESDKSSEKNLQISEENGENEEIPKNEEVLPISEEAENEENFQNREPDDENNSSTGSNTQNQDTPEVMEDAPADAQTQDITLNSENSENSKILELNNLNTSGEITGSPDQSDAGQEPEHPVPELEVPNPEQQA